MEELAQAHDALRLTPIEARILGCLVEKEATTPETYPLTENAVLLACNQKSNRDPVLELSAGEVGHALRAMEERQLLRRVHGARAVRYEHRFAQAFSLTVQQQALLAVLLLRGPQTAAELQARSERLASFADPEQLRHVLERLAQRSPALVADLGRAPGQREDRYMHLLCGPVERGSLVAPPARPVRTADAGDVEARLAALESAVESLRAEVERLRAGG
jgi:hypothetical protein